GTDDPAPFTVSFTVAPPSPFGRRSVRLTVSFQGLSAVRACVRFRVRLAPSAPIRPWVSVPEAAALAAHGLRRWHYAEPGVLLETVGFDRGISGQDALTVDRQAMHVG